MVIGKFLDRMADFETSTSIPEFFKGRDVFMTGGTGFVGKCLIEKLLRSCPDVGTIYVLARPKKGVPAEQRLKVFTDCPVRQAKMLPDREDKGKKNCYFLDVRGGWKSVSGCFGEEAQDCRRGRHAIKIRSVFLTIVTLPFYHSYFLSLPALLHLHS